jgi:hypothetical protein
MPEGKEMKFKLKKILDFTETIIRVIRTVTEQTKPKKKKSPK